ncbi:MAG: AAA family ATPase [Planctomycetes bacterium]|nr:AAA family ATPase [Planctomycetota bacterium]
MGAILAFSGKGGSGKTTLAAMVLRQLLRIGVRPVLAVDADPNATLGLTLGVPVEHTIADLRERMGAAAMNVTEIPKERLLDQWLAEILVEDSGFDVLTMGRPEGPKCYCYVNGLLRRYLKELRGAYPVVVVDCEAGMEYLSRLTVDDIDSLILVTEATPVGMTTVARISRLADALPIKVKRRILAVNKAGQLGPALATPYGRAINGVSEIVHVPFDEDLYRRCAQALPVDDQAGLAARQAVEALTRLCLPQPDPHTATPR